MDHPLAELVLDDDYTDYKGCFQILQQVHDGPSPQGGHYYTFCRPDGRTWYKFDDERVTEESMEAAIHQEYGGCTSLCQL